MSLEYKRAWWGRLAGVQSLYSVIRNDQFIGYAARWRSGWLVGLPDGYGTWETVPVINLPIICRRREDVATRLACIAEGLIQPGELS